MKSMTSTALMALAAAMPSAAQNLSFGADNFFRSPDVAIKPITFASKYDNTIVGNLFTRHDARLNETHAAIVVGHPMGAVKEQGANLYAGKLAEQGFVTLTLDLPFFGSSPVDGQQNIVSPDYYTEAYSAAVDHLGTYGFVDRERIGALGICGSGGFVLAAAKLDSRIKAVGTASMYDMGAVNRDGLRNAQSIEERKEIIDQASQQRWTALDGGPVAYTATLPTELPSDADAVTAEFFDFYRTTRGEVVPPGWQRNLTVARTLDTNVKFMNFYPYNDLDVISPRPILLVAGTKAHSREFSEDAFRAAAEPKELHWIPNAGHADLYDRTELIPFVKYTEFFRTNLA